jgi:hypothetical protein
MAYYMQEISAEEENWACPNSASPRRWYNCPGLTECRGPASVVKAAKFNSPLHLECIDRSPYLHGLCTKARCRNMAELAAGRGWLLPPFSRPCAW